MNYYDYKNKIKVEAKESNSLNFLYNNIIGRFILKILMSKFIANVVACYMNSGLSKHRIKRFIKKNNICIEEYEVCKYKSFNDFFMRNIKPEKRPIKDGTIAIADSKLSVYKINKNLSLNIKNSIYTIDELIQDDAKEFENGYVFVYRLAVDDYHHYIYPSDGNLVSSKRINGILHTVQPIALKKHKVFSENTREVSILETNDYGKVAYIEVGAMMIGKIVNENKSHFHRGEEKGHFEFGGSTIILIFQENKVKVNNLILENTKNDIETIVKMGENLE